MSTSITEARSLGIGLSGIADFSTQIPFLDAFKSARAWIPQSSTQWDTGEAAQLNLDPQGWVQSVPATNAPAAYDRVSTLMLWDVPYESGQYRVLYDGTGTMQYGLDASKLSSSPGMDLVQADSLKAGGIHLQIMATDPNQTGDYLRNIRVYSEKDLPLVELGMRFNPEFLDRIKNFGMLRYMDWMSTNNSRQQDWSNRPLMSDATWSRKGVPIELMVQLANETGTNPWFNMPHSATDDYIRRFATYVRDHLDPKLKAYVEYSNEVWNWQFSQAGYAEAQAKQRWGESPAGWGGWMQWYGMRAAQTADIWKSVYSSESPSRLVRVIATHTGWKGLEAAILNPPAWIAEGQQPVYQSFDAYAVTGYFGGSLGQPDHASTVRSWLSDPDGGFSKAFQQLRQGNSLPSKDSIQQTIDSFRYQADVAKQHGLQLVAYEGGQHIVGINGVQNDAQLTNFFIELNRHPEMQAIYQDLLNGWRAAGGTQFNQYSDIGAPNRWGSWGALENLDQASSPKYKALETFMANNAPWWNAGGSSTRIGLYERSTAADNSLVGTEYNDIFLGGAGSDSIKGGAGADRLHGGDGNDAMEGNAGADRLAGGPGSDSIKGGNENDLLTGGAGNDQLSGDAGSDAYVFDSWAPSESANLGVDTLNFQPGDKIALSRYTFAAGTRFSIAATDANAATRDAQITYSRATGNLFYNPNGKAPGFGIGGRFAVISGKPVLSDSDFIRINGRFDPNDSIDLSRAQTRALKAPGNIELHANYQPRHRSQDNQSLDISGGDRLLGLEDRLTGRMESDHLMAGTEAIQLDDDHKLAIKRPTALFNAGVINLPSKQGVIAAMRAAFRDKNIVQSGNQVLQAGEAVLFRSSNQTYLAVNSAKPSLNLGQDLLIDVTGTRLAIGDAGAETLDVSRYFA
ncbi:hypothetical protein NDI45_04770 [Leptolyngbya sp. GB1-A1]|uniref:calcium-binding protein n=1 Tax=Leptolyngbya sp. GB1-A1 TaxID=2933908 RepID=UPI00329969FC